MEHWTTLTPNRHLLSCMVGTSVAMCVGCTTCLACGLGLQLEQWGLRNWSEGLQQADRQGYRHGWQVRRRTAVKAFWQLPRSSLRSCSWWHLPAVLLQLDQVQVQLGLGSVL